MSGTTIRDPKHNALACYADAEQLVGDNSVLEDLEPEVLSYLLDRKDVPRTNIDKVHAICLVLRTPALFLEDWGAHEKVVLALNNRPVLSEIGQDADPPELCWAVHALVPLILDRISDVDGLADTTVEELVEGGFSNDVLEYWAQELHEDGYCLAPRLLRACQPHLDALLLPHARAMQAQVLASVSRTEQGDMSDVIWQQVELLRMCDQYVSHMGSEV
jgi:hypothetical protein